QDAMFAAKDTLPDVEMTWGALERLCGEYEKAVKHGARSVEIGPGHSDALAVYGETLIRRGRVEDGIGLLLEAMKYSPSYDAWYLVALGDALRILDRVDQSEDALLSAIDINNSLARAHAYLAATYVRMGAQDLSRREAETVRIIDPNFSVDHFVRWA